VECRPSVSGVTAFLLQKSGKVNTRRQRRHLHQSQWRVPSAFFVLHESGAFPELTSAILEFPDSVQSIPEWVAWEDNEGFYGSAH